MTDLAALDLARTIRAACVEAALQAYEDAGLQGLCHEGRWECAIEAIRGLDLAEYVTAPPTAAPAPEPPEGFAPPAPAGSRATDP